MKSVDIFKTIISEYIPEYLSTSNEEAISDAKSFFGKSNSAGLFAPPISLFEEKLLSKGINLNNLREEFLSDLASNYLNEPSNNDLITSFLLETGNIDFLKQIEFAHSIKLAFQKIERKEKKELLKQLDEYQEEEEIRAAFHRIERAEKKKLLQEIEGLEILEPTGTEFTAYSVNPVQENIPHSIKPVAAKNQIPWKFIIRIAAVLILVLVPVGISILFFGDDETSVGGKSPKPKNGKSIIYAETGDLTEIKRINIPLPNVDNRVIEIVNNEQSFGFATKEENVTISVVFTGDQIDYLAEKITLLEKKVKELKTKNIKDKEATIKSLVDISTKCISEKQILESKEFTYQFDKKSFKLTIFSSKKIDPENLKVYSLKNEDESLSYYLKYGNKDYDLKEIKGLLKVASSVTKDVPNSIRVNKTNISHNYKDNFNYIFLKNDLAGVSFKIEISCYNNCNGDDFMYSIITDNSIIKIDHIGQINKITSRTFVIKVTTEFNGEYRTDIKKNVKFKC